MILFYLFLTVIISWWALKDPTDFPRNRKKKRLAKLYHRWWLVVI